MYSFGFQHAFQRGIEASDNVFLTKVLYNSVRAWLRLTQCGQCFEAATIVIKQMIDVLAPSGLMRSAPDGKFKVVLNFLSLISRTGHFIFASFASAFLLKVYCKLSFPVPYSDRLSQASSTGVFPDPYARDGG